MVVPEIGDMPSGHGEATWLKAAVCFVSAVTENQSPLLNTALGNTGLAARHAKTEKPFEVILWAKTPQ